MEPGRAWRKYRWVLIAISVLAVAGVLLLVRGRLEPVFRISGDNDGIRLYAVCPDGGNDLLDPKGKFIEQWINYDAFQPRGWNDSLRREFVILLPESAGAMEVQTVQVHIPGASRRGLIFPLQMPETMSFRGQPCIVFPDTLPDYHTVPLSIAGRIFHSVRRRTTHVDIVVTYSIGPAGATTQPAIQRSTTFHNVRVLYPDRPHRTYSACLDQLAERLGLPQAIDNPPLKSPMDALKVIDLVRGEHHIRLTHDAIRHSTPRLQFHDLPPEDQERVLAAARNWVGAGSLRVQAAGAQLGLWAGAAEFVPHALRLIDSDGHQASAVAHALLEYSPRLTATDVQRLRQLQKQRPHKHLNDLLLRIVSRSDDPVRQRILMELCQADDPWLWWPAIDRAMGAAATRSQLVALAEARPVMRQRLLLCRPDALEPATPPELAAATVYLGRQLSPRLVAMDLSCFAEMLRTYTVSAGREAGTPRLIEFLRQLVNEWDAHQVPHYASSNWWAVDRITRQLNAWHTLDLGGVGPDTNTESPQPGRDWKALAGQVIEWHEGLESKDHSSK